MKSAVSFIVYGILLLVLGAGIFFIYRYTNGFNEDFKTFYIERDGKKILAEKSDATFEPGSEVRFDVGYTFDGFKSETRDYSVTVLPNPEEDFDFEVSGLSYAWRMAGNLDEYFSLDKQAAYFTLSVPQGGIKDLLCKIYHETADLSEAFPEGADPETPFFLLRISAYNGAVTYDVVFSVFSPYKVTYETEGGTDDMIVGITYRSGGKRVTEADFRYGMIVYLIYIQPMLILSNFAIRSDDDQIDFGNFPAWRDDFFRHDPDPMRESRFSKILNQDLIRPGKQVDPKCKYKDCFEFGILAETEVGKERGNQFDRHGKSAESAEANILNDQRDNLFKLMGHLGTVYNIPFAFYVGDEQRPGSWGANGKELCDVITIRERCRDKIVMPFFAFEELLYLAAMKFFGERYYDQIRMLRGDTSLLTYVLMHLCGKIFDHYRYIRDKFGGHFNKVNVERAMKQDGDGEALSKSKIFIANAKVYAKAFRTAGWKPFMEQRAANSKYGLEDVPSYHGLDPFLDEFLEQRSYFFTQLLKSFSGQEQERALDLIVRTLTLFYHDAETFFDKKTAQALLEELTEVLPQITKEDNFAEMKKKLTQKREMLLASAKKKWDEQQAKKENGKGQAEKAAAAES